MDHATVKLYSVCMYIIMTLFIFVIQFYQVYSNQILLDQSFTDTRIVIKASWYNKCSIFSEINSMAITK